MENTQQLPLQTIQASYEELGMRVRTALRTQIGDAARLNAHRDECLRLMMQVQAVSVMSTCRFIRGLLILKAF
jgi:hypothetical protein